MTLTEFRELLTTPAYDVGLGALIILIYVLLHVVKKKTDQINLTNIVTVFGSGFSILPGLSVALAGFEANTPAKGIEVSYFFIGGLAVVYVGFQEIGNKFKAI